MIWATHLAGTKNISGKLDKAHLGYLFHNFWWYYPLIPIWSFDCRASGLSSVLGIFLRCWSLALLAWLTVYFIFPPLNLFKVAVTHYVQKSILSIGEGTGRANRSFLTYKVFQFGLFKD